MSSIIRIFSKVFPPLISLFILILGNGLFTTLLVIRLHIEGASSLVIGAMAGAYYAGLVCGSFRVEKFIVRVGHIRAFSAFASALGVVCLLQGMILSYWVWILLRLLGGFTTAGLFVVIESWLLILGTEKIRGQILALYMIALYGAQALGQFLINLGDPKALTLFAVTAMLSSLSVIPLAMTKVGQPQISEPSTLNFKKLYKASGSGVIGCFTAGLILGAVYGLLPLFIAQKTGYPSEVAFFMAITILGGMALQYPVGKLSDHLERRTVLIVIALLAAITSVFTLIGFHIVWLAVITLFLFGGVTFTLYPISTSQACDNLEPQNIVSGTQSLLLAYSIGATLGPFVAPAFIHYLGINGLFVYFIVTSLLLFIFFLWRRIHVPTKGQEENFISLPNTTPITSKLDPRGEL